MKVLDRQQVGAPFGQPFGALLVLALGAMAVAAGIVSDADVGAVVAFFAMAAKRRRAAGLDGAHGAELGAPQPVLFPVSGAVLAKNAGHFESGPWPGAYFFGGLAFAGLTSASSGLGGPATTCAATAV